MVTRRGKSGVKRYFNQVRADIGEKLLPGAARAGAKVIAAAAAEECESEEVARAITVKVKKDAIAAAALVTVKGDWERSLAFWLEWGTDPHFVSVDDSQREGLSVRKINEGALEIDGQFVGTTVFHPGARPHPFLRPALDQREADAIAAAQAYITGHTTRAGIVGDSEGGAE